MQVTRNQTNHHANDRTNHRSFCKFRSIPWNCENSAARLEILRPAENCGPTD